MKKNETILNEYSIQRAQRLRQYSRMRSEKAKYEALQIRKKAQQKIQKLSDNELFHLGIGLYWGEGYKGHRENTKWQVVDFTNSDPSSVACFRDFLVRCCGVNPKAMKLQIHIHEGNDVEQIVRFWSMLLKIPKENIMKPMIMKTKSKNSKRKVEYGVVHLRVYDRRLFHTIGGWLDGAHNLYVA